MAKMSFQDQSAPVVEEPRDNAEVSKALTTAVTTVSDYVEDDDMAGESLGKYVRHPYLNILSKNSKEGSVEEFGLGAWVVSDTKVGQMDTPIRVIAIKAAMAWQEQVVYGSGVRARIFATSQEAHQAGLSTDWEARKAKRPSAAEVLNVLLWMPKPEGIDAPHIFSEDGPEGPGALVKYFAARSAFGTIGKTIIDAHQRFLRKEKGGLVAGQWDLTATKEPGPNNSTYLLPRLKPAGATSADLAAFLRKLTA